MATFVANDANYAGNMLHGILKQDQIHGSIGLVVLGQGRVKSLVHLDERRHLIVHGPLKAVGKVRKYQWLGILLRVVPGDGKGREGLLALRLDQGVVFREIRRANQPIAIDAFALVQPEEDELVGCRYGVRRRNQQTLKDLRNLPHGELVEEVDSRLLEGTSDQGMKAHGSLENGRALLLHLVSKG